MRNNKNYIKCTFFITHIYSIINMIISLTLIALNQYKNLHMIKQ